MSLRNLSRLAVIPLFVLALSTLSSAAQNSDTALNTGPVVDGSKLQFVVFLSRHGVRSPTAKPAQYNRYSATPWPEWSVQPGYLTSHGYKLMTLFGAYDRAKLSEQGLLPPSGCADAAHVTILADSDQRTRETGKAIAEGMFPGCTVDVHALPEGSDDPLFHSLHAGIGQTDKALAEAALAGRIGGNPANLTEAYRPQLSALDRVLSGCGNAQPTDHQRTSLFDVPSSLAPGAGDHPVELHGPLSVASTLSENLLLEYTEGFAGADLGWGCLDEASLRHVMQLHVAAADFSQRTPVIARIYASNLLDHILRAMQQSVDAKPVLGAPGKSGDRILFLSGHDTNISTVAGALGLTWIIDGRREDTPPGGALVFELWRLPGAGAYTVRTFYTAQTLDQMRAATPLTLASPPALAPVFIPGCAAQDGACPWQAFSATVRQAISPQYVTPDASR
jgi:4-phytase/acid phosphatase